MAEEITFKIPEKINIKKYLPVLLILIPIILCATLRLYSQEIPQTDVWAKSTVDNYYKQGIAQEILKGYPNLPMEQVTKIVEEQYKTYYTANKVTIDQQVTQYSTQFKQVFKDENGYTYMGDIDPYDFLRKAENYIDHGYTGDIIVNGTMWDMHMLAPNGIKIANDPHSIVLAYMYKIMHIFNSRITPMQAATYFPILFSCLCLIPIFFIGRRLGGYGTVGNLCGFFSAMTLAVNTALFMRTTWSHADTDIWNIFFPVYIIWLFFLSLDTKDIKTKIFMNIGTGLLIGIFSLLWSGWFYVFYLIVGGIIAYVLYLYIMKIRQEIKSYLISTISFVTSSFIFVSLFTSPTVLKQALWEVPFSVLNIKDAAHANLWPNVYTTVAELNGSTIASIISMVGGSLFFYGSILGIILLGFKEKRKYIYEAVFLGLWFVILLYASLTGVRFSMMLAPSIALGIGVLISLTYEKILTILDEGTLKKVLSIIMILLCCLIFLPQMGGDIAIAKNDVPMINDAWVSVLTKIKIESQPDAIVNSWWDFGHHFKYFADRAVTFDGATQNTPMAHWIGRTLLTSDENEARSILRMLDCGSNDAFNLLNEQIKDTQKTIKMLKKEILMSKNSARVYLQENGINDVDTILVKTHCNPPENYLITSDDMISKGAVWAHFGSWDFNKADVWMNDKNLPQTQALANIKEHMGVNDSDAKNIYYQMKSLTNENDANQWIAPWPGYAGRMNCAIKDNETINCNGIIINRITKEVDIQGKKPNSIVYIENGIFNVKQFENGVGTSLILQYDPLAINYVLTACSPEIATSMFTRLYFFDGIGLNNFKKFTEAQQPTGGMIYVWTVNW